MKNHIAPIALSLLAGAITVSAQPQERRQKPQRRPDAAYGQHKDACPACGQQRRSAGQQKQRKTMRQPQRQGPQQQQFKGPYGQQFQRKGPPQQQFKGRQYQYRGPQQQQFAKQRNQQFQQRGPQRQPPQYRGPQQFKGPRGQQFQQRGPQSQQRPSPEQIRKMQMKRRAMLKQYDRDGDGSLSERERAALRRDFQKKQGAQQKHAPGRPDPEGRQRGPYHQQ